eukprot:Unigene7124_Nuclearia_a/m.21848 Unigene7124_Nuclearia_a/g.21848  ORF Unigene7124_Nuclearia_a/g.21848 Unigene7124_Nuclearia_a/m.21848 type:complete len:122 (+) Unigene7124_Nuclearia_a:1688-2053(+)
MRVCLWRRRATRARPDGRACFHAHRAQLTGVQSGEVLRNVPVLVGGGPEAEAMPLTYVRIGRGDSADGVTLKRRFLDGQESLPTYPPELAFLKAVWCRDTRAGRWLAVGSATTLVHVRHIP